MHTMGHMKEQWVLDLYWYSTLPAFPFPVFPSRVSASRKVV